jgi:hydrogenase maturation protease
MNLNCLKESLNIYKSQKIIFIGLGNKIRGDDWAGIYFLRRLKNSGLFNDSLFIEAGISPENYISAILKFNPGVIVFIDAVSNGCLPGEIEFIDPDTIDQLGISTHAYSVRIIEKYISYERKVKFFYLGIVPLHTNMEKGISLPVLNGINNFFHEKTSSA